jgi:hypothetical protein
MRVRMGLVGAMLVLVALGFMAATLVVSGASAHSSPCHTDRTCPSDHHTFVWTDPSTGLLWDCVEPGAPEFNPVLDTSVIVYDALTYYCRQGVSTTTTMSTSTTTSIATTATETTTTTGPPATTATTTTPPPTVVLPSKSLSPGVFYAAVRQGTIKKTICRAGWTAKIRPPVSYTNALKLQQMQQYEETGSPADYEEDHLIPLELGGAPMNPKNLWPEPRAQANTSDPLETKLKRQVCKGSLKLAKARATIRAFKFANG